VNSCTNPLPATSYMPMCILRYMVNYITIVIILFIYDLFNFFIGILYHAHVVSNDKALNESRVHTFSKNHGATS
jgi:hypothetical protein